jgi:hypothetical protein
MIATSYGNRDHWWIRPEAHQVTDLNKKPQTYPFGGSGRLCIRDASI